MLCFGPPDRSALVGRGEAVILPNALGDIDNAARLAHLLSHATPAAALPSFDATLLSCDEVVERALDAEARAHEIERALREELGGPSADAPPTPRGAGASPAGAARERRVSSDTSHPSAGSNRRFELERAYRMRCEGARVQAAARGGADDMSRVGRRSR
jgi:hypothetical protein